MARPGVWPIACATVALAAIDAGSAPPLAAQADSAGIPVVTARVPLWGPGEGWTVGDEPRFSVRSIALGDGGSAQWILRRDEPPREVNGDHVEAWVEWALSVSRGDTDTIVRRARETSMASTLPVLQSLYLDAVGNLWVGEAGVRLAGARLLSRLSYPPPRSRGHSCTDSTPISSRAHVRM